MTQYVKVGGSWRTIAAPNPKVSSVWRTTQQAYVKVSGTWRTFFQALGAVLPTNIIDYASEISPTDANVTLAVNSNGTWSTNGQAASSGTWQAGGTAADYQVRLSKTAGTDTSGSALATWLSCSLNNSWTLSETTNGNATRSFTGTLEIRMAASPNTVLDTATVDLDATVDV